MQKEEYLIKNACYSLAKYYLCKQNNKRSLLGRKQRSQVVRSFLNRYQFSYANKVTSLFSIRYILIIILECKVAISAFRRNYLCKIDVVLSRGKYKGCGVYIRFNAVVRFVVPFSFGFSSEVR